MTLTAYFTKIVGISNSNNLRKQKLQRSRYSEDHSLCNLDDIYIRKSDHEILGLQEVDYSDVQPATTVLTKNSSKLPMDFCELNLRNENVLLNDDKSMIGWGIQIVPDDDKSIAGKLKTNSLAKNTTTEQRNSRLLSIASDYGSFFPSASLTDKTKTDANKSGDKHSSRLRFVAVASDYFTKYIRKFSSLEECNDGWTNFDGDEKKEFSGFLHKNEDCSIQTYCGSDVLNSSVQSVTVLSNEFYNNDDCNTVSDISDCNTVPKSTYRGTFKETVKGICPTTAFNHLGIEADNLVDVVEVRPSRSSFNSFPFNINQTVPTDANMWNRKDDCNTIQTVKTVFDHAEVAELGTSDSFLDSISFDILGTDVKPHVNAVNEQRNSKSILRTISYKSNKTDISLSRSDTTFNDTVCINFKDMDDAEDTKKAPSTRIRTSTFDLSPLRKVLIELESSLKALSSSLVDLNQNKTVDSTGTKSNSALDSISINLSRMKSSINKAFASTKQSEMVDLSGENYNIIHEQCVDSVRISKKSAQDPNSIKAFLDTDTNGKLKTKPSYPKSRSKQQLQKKQTKSSFQPSSRGNFSENPLHSRNATRNKINPLPTSDNRFKLREDPTEPLVNQTHCTSPNTVHQFFIDTNLVKRRVSTYFGFVTKPAKAT